jgi:hypothetical protein
MVITLVLEHYLFFGVDEIALGQKPTIVVIDPKVDLRFRQTCVANEQPQERFTRRAHTPQPSAHPPPRWIVGNFSPKSSV